MKLRMAGKTYLFQQNRKNEEDLVHFTSAKIKIDH